jgi:undecaprenyl-diphosphatase
MKSATTRITPMPGRFAGAHFVSIALLLLGIGAVAFLAFSGIVMDGGTQALDERLLLAMREPGDPNDPLGPAWVEELFRDFTALGGVGVLSLLTLSAAGYLWLRKMRHAASFLVAAVVGGLLLSSALKAGFDRPRPDFVSHGSQIYTSSFPSGHSMLAAVVFLTIGAMLAAVHRRRRVQAYILGWCVLVTLLVGTSRVYLGVHWPSDVVAGWFAGAAWAAACWLFAHWLLERGRMESDRDPTPSRATNPP